MVVCHCLAINDVTIRELLEAGALSVEEIASRCGAAVSYTHLTLPTICSV